MRVKHYWKSAIIKTLYLNIKVHTFWHMRHSGWLEYVPKRMDFFVFEYNILIIALF